MALYVYKACEYKFCGLYDIEVIKVIEANNFEDAEEAAKEASYDLIMSSSNVYESLYEEAHEKYQKIYGISYEEDSFNDKFSAILNKLIADDIYVQVFELDDEQIEKLELSIEELQEMAEEDIEDFIADYAMPIFY